MAALCPFSAATGRGGLGMVDLYVSNRDSDGVFGPPVPLSELNNTFSEQRPTIRHDGLEIFFYANRPGGVGMTDLWVATRETLSQVWNTPENLGPVVNSLSTDFHPSIRQTARRSTSRRLVAME